MFATIGQDWWHLIISCGLLAINLRSMIEAIRSHDEIARDLAWDSSMRCTALRDGEYSKIDSKDLVLGDVIRIKEVYSPSR